MIIKHLFCILSVVFISACAVNNSSVKPNDVILAPIQSTVVIPPELLKPCEPLSKLDARTYPETDMVTQANIWRKEHVECMNSDNSLVAVVKKAFNIPDASTADSAVTTSK